MIREGYLVKVITAEGRLDVPWVQVPDGKVVPMFRNEDNSEMLFKTMDAAEFAIKQEVRQIPRYLTIVKVFQT